MHPNTSNETPLDSMLHSLQQNSTTSLASKDQASSKFMQKLAKHIHLKQPKALFSNQKSPNTKEQQTSIHSTLYIQRLNESKTSSSLLEPRYFNSKEMHGIKDRLGGNKA